MAPHLTVLPHTHWDREWYRTHEQFRFRLVRLMDGLLDLLETDPEFSHFTLDGQTIVLDDYFEVRPEARPRVEALVRSGRLLIGPWYVLPDEWLVSGEALVRNFRLGLERAEAVGGTMNVGYVPDQFGHVGQMPQILSSFGMVGSALWRGVGVDVEETLFDWEAPDGTTLPTIYLIQGYSNFVHPPLEPDALEARLRQAMGVLKPNSRIESYLLMNGSDHVEPRPGLAQALKQVATTAGDFDIEIGTLPGFLERALRESPAQRPHHRGELRSGLRCPLLEGCASARMPQKRADFANDRLLTRYLEPLASWLGELGGDPDPEMLELAWRIALENHPHDSICGCSVDAVHREMDVRFERVAQIAGAHLAEVTHQLGAAVRIPESGFGRGAGEGIIVWNPHGPGVGSVEGTLELDGAVTRGRAAPMHLRRAGGERIPVHVDVADEGATLADYSMHTRIAAVLVDGFPEEFTGLYSVGFNCREGAPEDEVEIEILLSSEPCAAAQVAAEKRALLDKLAAMEERPARYRVRRLPRFTVRWVDELPGHGLRVYRLAKGAARNPASLLAEKTADGGARIENEWLRVEVDAQGRVRCEDLARSVAIEDAIRLVDEGDRGDEYTFQPIDGGDTFEHLERVRVRLGPRSEAEVSIRIEGRLSVPAGLGPERSPQGRATLPVSILLRLARRLDRLDVDVEVDNTARDHRLRVHLRSPFEAERFEVESAFEVAERPIAPGPGDFGSERPSEFPIGCTPQRGFASVTCGDVGFTVSNRGSAEVEAVREADGSTSLAVTVLRAVGWLSRDDLALRPGHAGPSLETPGAQVPGPHRAELALRIHAADAPDRASAAHRHGVPALAFRGGREQGALSDGSRLLEIESAEWIVSAIEPRKNGEVRIRLYNTTPSAVSGPIRWNGRVSGLEAIDLADRPAPDVALTESRGGEGAAEKRDQHLSVTAWQLVGLRPR